LRDKRLYAKCLAEAEPSLRADEKIEAIETASIVNPWLEAAAFSPILILTIPALYNTVTAALAALYVASLAIYFRRKARMLVFTDQRVLVFESKAFYGFKSGFNRELPKMAIPVTGSRGYWSHFTWTRYSDIDEAMYIFKN
jgi:hypothetical protein